MILRDKKLPNFGMNQYVEKQVKGETQYKN